MKTLVNFVFMLLVLPFLACQSNSDAQVPEAVRQAFQTKYPGEDDPDWHKDQNGNFESNFKMDGESYRADFSPDGTWVETERSIKKDKLPKAIRKILKDDYDDFKVVEVELVEHPSKGTFYDVEIEKDGDKQDLEFNEAGERIN